MAKKDDRFEIILSEGSSLSSSRQILLDKVTGVQYLFVQSGYGGGLTPLLDGEGRPLTWKV